MFGLAQHLAAAEQVVQVEEAVQVNFEHAKEYANPKVRKVEVKEITADKTVTIINVSRIKIKSLKESKNPFIQYTP